MKIKFKPFPLGHTKKQWKMRYYLKYQFELVTQILVEHLPVKLKNAIKVGVDRNDTAIYVLNALINSPATVAKRRWAHFNEAGFDENQYVFCKGTDGYSYRINWTDQLEIIRYRPKQYIPEPCLALYVDNLSNRWPFWKFGLEELGWDVEHHLTMSEGEWRGWSGNAIPNDVVACVQWSNQITDYLWDTYVEQERQPHRYLKPVFFSGAMDTEDSSPFDWNGIRLYPAAQLFKMLPLHLPKRYL